MVLIHTLREDAVPTEEEQEAIDKCIKQPNDCASANTVLWEKHIILQLICHDYCHLPQRELEELHTKDELYTTSVAWVCVPHTLQERIRLSTLSGGRKYPFSRELCTECEGQSDHWHHSWQGHHGCCLGRQGTY